MFLSFSQNYVSLISDNMFEKLKNQKGFSLIELIIVILIIGIIAVIAIPNLLAARRSANESAAISSLRSLHSAQSVYITSIGAGNYAGTNSSNGDIVGVNALQTAGLVDPVLGSGTKSGYNFVGAITLSGSGSPATFFFSANPTAASGISQTGTRRYCVSQVGGLGYDPSNLAIPFTSITISSSIPFS